MENIKNELKDIKTKTVERRGGKLKLQIKLNADQALAWKNFQQTLHDHSQMDDNEFAKVVLFTGMDVLGRKVIAEYEKEHGSLEVIEDENSDTPIDVFENPETFGEDKED